MFKFLGAPYPLLYTAKGYLPVVSGLETIKADLLQLLTTYPGERCLTGDTLIPLANGIEKTIKNLVGEPPFWVYSFDTNSNSIVAGKATAHKTQENAELFEITLDNGKKIRCTSNHLWLLRDATYCRTDQLNIGQSLMPLYKHLNTSGYERVYQPKLGDYKETHLCFVEGTRLTGQREVVHHKDLNKLNNAPDNLQWMTCEDHKILHKEIKENPEFKKDWILKLKSGLKKYYSNHDGSRKGAILTGKTKQKLSENKKKYFQTEEGILMKKHLSDLALEQFKDGQHPMLGKQHSEKSKKKLKLAWQKRKQKNHKIVLIEKLSVREDCYDLSVDKYHNFAVSAGVFVHNCMLPSFGIRLRDLVFEQNDSILQDQARIMIINAINQWEPRITVDAIEISSNVNRGFLNTNDDYSEIDKILGIRILFKDPQDITTIQELVLEVPL